MRFRYSSTRPTVVICFATELETMMRLACRNRPCVPAVDVAGGAVAGVLRPDVPRNADGKPNLNAPAPRLANGKPDLSGVWESRIPPSGRLGGP